MAKKRKSRTAGFLSNKPEAKLPTPEEVNQTIAKITGKEQPIAPTRVNPQETNVPPPPEPTPTPVKRVPLTTAITPENRAKLEVAAINSEFSVADLLNEALEYYFEDVHPAVDEGMVEMFKKIFGRKSR